MNILTRSVSEPIEAVGNVLDKLFTSEEERLNLDIAKHRLALRASEVQVEINKVEASHRSLFVAGWRPFIGWVCGISLFYAYLIYPFLLWYTAYLSPNLQPPQLVTDNLFELVIAMLEVDVVLTRLADEAVGHLEYFVVGSRREGGLAHERDHHAGGDSTFFEVDGEEVRGATVEDGLGGGAGDGVDGLQATGIAAQTEGPALDLTGVVVDVGGHAGLIARLAFGAFADAEGVSEGRVEDRHGTRLGVRSEAQAVDDHAHVNGRITQHVAVGDRVVRDAFRQIVGDGQQLVAATDAEAGVIHGGDHDAVSDPALLDIDLLEVGRGAAEDHLRGRAGRGGREAEARIVADPVGPGFDLGTGDVEKTRKGRLGTAQAARSGSEPQRVAVARLREGRGRETQHQNAHVEQSHETFFLL